MDKGCQDLKQVLANLNRDLRDTQSRKELLHERDHCKKELEAARKHLGTVEAKANHHLGDLTEKNRELHENNRELEAARRRLHTVETKANQHFVELAEASRELDNLKQERDDLKHKLADMFVDLQEKDKALEAATKNVSTEKEALAAIYRRAMDVQEAVCHRHAAQVQEGVAPSVIRRVTPPWLIPPSLDDVDRILDTIRMGARFWKPSGRSPSALTQVIW